MIYVNLCGGTGNQLFQAAFARSLYPKYEVALLDSCSQYGSQINRFNISIPVRPHPGWRWISERSLRYDPNPEIEDNSILAGYYQTEKYFKNIESEIRKEFTLRESPSDSAQRAADLIDKAPNSVMLHIRRGDYLTWAQERHGVLPVEYYASASEIIAKQAPDAHFFVFSDDASYGMTLSYPTTRVACTSHEDLWLMSKCRHAIVANSSFSWWGAWLGPDVHGGIIIAPEQWFATGNEDSRDIVPERWTRLGHEKGIDNGSNGAGWVIPSGAAPRQRVRGPRLNP